MRTAILIPNYNMPERTEALCENIIRRVKDDYSIIVVDNASDLKPPASTTAVRLEKNVQTTGAWLKGLEYAKSLKKKFDYYWFIITSAEFDDGDYDPLAPMVEFMELNPGAVGIHPSLTTDSTTSWKQLITRGGDAPRRTWMIDNIASLYRADWFDSIGWFDPRFIYAWGIDLETCFLARQQERSIWVDERVKMKKITNIGYSMNRMNMSADDRSRLAGENMRLIMREKYGPEWWMMMTEANVRPEWK